MEIRVVPEWSRQKLILQSDMIFELNSSNWLPGKGIVQCKEMYPFFLVISLPSQGLPNSSIYES